MLGGGGGHVANLNTVHYFCKSYISENDVLNVQQSHKRGIDAKWENSTLRELKIL